MVKYIVVQMVQVEEPVGPEEDDVVDYTQTAVVLCKDSREVHAAIRPMLEGDRTDWRLFEVMPDGKTRSRAVVFKMDGKVSYDVEIS